MTVAIATVEPVTTNAPAGTCWDCGGPCLTYKGSEHGWRCRTCCARYVVEAADRGAVREAQERAKRTAKQRNAIYANTAVCGRLRRGSGSTADASQPPAYRGGT